MKKKGFAAGLCFMAVVTIALIGAGIGSTEWTVMLLVDDDDNNLTSNYCDVTRKVGLFRLVDSLPSTATCLNPGYKLDESVYNDQLLVFNQGLQQAVIAFCVLGMVCSLVAMAVAAFNICSNPYEHYLTPLAMLTYNAVGLGMSLLAVILYTVLLYGDFQDPLPDKQPVNPSSDVYKPRYKVESSYFGFSFFLVVASIITHLFGAFLAGMSERDVVVSCFEKKEEENNNKGQDVMMF